MTGPRPVTVTEQVVYATPDIDAIARAHTIDSQAWAQLRGGRGVVGYDRGHPSRSFTGPVPAAPNIDAAIAAIGQHRDAIRYMPPDMHDAAIPNSALGSLAVTQYNRMTRR